MITSCISGSSEYKHVVYIFDAEEGTTIFSKSRNSTEDTKSNYTKI